MSRATSALRDRMVFIVGARRSGTNTLQRILSAHHEVVGVPSETFFFAHAIAPLTERFQHTATSPTTGLVYMEREALLDALRELCDAVFLGVRASLRPDATRIVERTPDHVRFLPLIAQIYPDARFIHIIRDGRDVARSLLSLSWGPTSMKEAAEEWRSAVDAGRAAGPALKHYREVRYEDLVSNTSALIDDLFSWLDLGLSDDVTTLALAEARVPFNVDPASPAVAVGKWRTALSGSDLRVFDRTAGSLLRELGYEDAGSGAQHVAPDGPPGTESSPRPADRLAVALDSIRGRARSLRRRELLSTATVVQYVADRFLVAVTDGRFADAVAMLRPSALVRLSGENGDWRGRGEEARRRLVEAFSSDAALRGRLTRSEVHPAVPLVTTLLWLETDDGSVHRRIFVIGADRTAVTHVIAYRLD